MDQEVYKCQGSLLVPADYKLSSAWRERLVAGKTINIVLTRKKLAYPDGDPRFTLHGEKSLSQDDAVLFEVWLNKVKSYLIRADSWHEIVTCTDRCFALSFVEDEHFRVFFQKLEEVLKSLNKYQVCSVEQARESIVVMKANRIPPPKPPRTRLSTSKDQELPVLPAVPEAMPDVAESSPDESEPVTQSVAKKQSEYEMLIRQGTGKGSSDAADRVSRKISIGKDGSESRKVSKSDPKFLENLVQITKGIKTVPADQTSIPVSIGSNNRLRETPSPSQQVTGEVGKEPSTSRPVPSNFKSHCLIPETKPDLIDTPSSNDSSSQIRHQQKPVLSSTDILKSRFEPKSAQSLTTATQCGPSHVTPTGKNVGKQETVKRGNEEKPKKSPKPQGQLFNLPNTFTEFSVPDGEDWACSRCTLINSSSRSSCDACGDLRSTDQTPYLVYILPASAVSWMMSSRPEPEAAGPEVKSWICSVCSEVNKEDQLTCGSCQTWTCLHCTLHNTNDLRICSVCAKTRDYA